MTTLGRVARRARSIAGTIYRSTFPSPEVRAWRHACTLSETTPRFTPGTVRMMQYDLAYTDLLTFCPQWEDIFIERSLAFTSHVENPRILDCGANVGLSTLFFKRGYPAARVTAYEADPQIAEQLARNLRVNAAADVEVVAAAVWVENGMATFSAQGADAGTLRQFAHGVDRPSVQVPSRRLADVVARERIDLLKLDIEGAELEVLRDIAPHLGNVQAMLVEVHELQTDCRKLPEVLSIVGSAGFRYSISHVTRLPGPDRGTSRVFPQSTDAWVAAVCAWRNTSR